MIALRSGQGMAPVSAFELHDQVVKAHGVVPINGALVALRKNHLQVPVPAGHERCAALGCGNGEAAVELGDVVLPEKLVGLFQGADSAQPQLLRQPSLPGGEAALRATSRLRRVGRNHIHSQFLHGTAHLCRTVIIDLAAALRRQPEMGSAVGIERTEQSLLFNHCPQPGHHREGRFLRRQLRIVDIAGGVIQDHDQVVLTLILKPMVFAAIDVQHHPRQWTPLTPLAMNPASGLALHQAGCLQSLLHPRVAQPDLMFFAELLMKVAHVQIEVPVPVKTENLIGLLLRHSSAAWLATSPVQQALVAIFLIDASACVAAAAR